MLGSLSDFNALFQQKKELAQRSSLFEDEILDKELDGLNVEKERDKLLKMLDLGIELQSRLVSIFDKLSFDTPRAKKEFLYKLFDSSIQEKEWTNVLILI